MNSRFPLVAVLLALVASLTLVSCQEDQSAAPSESKTERTAPVATPAEPTAPPDNTAAPAVERPFRIAFTSGLGSLPAYAARQRRWFEDRGFTVTFMEGQSDSRACLDLLTAGYADVAFGVSLQALLEAEMKTPGTWRILGFSAETKENPVGTFLVPVDSPAKSIADLKGLPVVAAGADYAPRMAEIALTGGTESVEKRIPLIQILPSIPFTFTPPDSPQALFAVGEVMATLTKGLPAERTMRSIGTAPLATAFFSPFPVQAIVIRNSLAAEAPESVAKLSEACAGLLDWCNESFAETLPILQKELNLDDESTLNIFSPLFVAPHAIKPDSFIRAAELWTGNPIPDDGRARILDLVRPVGK